MHSLIENGIKQEVKGHTERKIIRKEKKNMAKKNKVRTISEREYEEYVRALIHENSAENTDQEQAD